MMNWIFYGIIAVSFLFAILNGAPAEVGKAALDSAKGSVELAIGLVGYIALFLGLVSVVQAAGGLDWMAKLIKPILVRLFPDVPPDHPAMGAMVMNISANALGLGNAATPFGLKAMKELETLNKEPGTATDAMVLFLAINTSGVALLPTGIIGLRAQSGSLDPASIFPTTLLATGLSTLTAIIVTKLLVGLPGYARGDTAGGRALSQLFATLKLLGGLALGVGLVCAATYGLSMPLAGPLGDKSIVGGALVVGLPLLAACFVLKGERGELLRVVAFGSALVGLVSLVYAKGEAASSWIMPTLIFLMLSVGVLARVKVYEEFVKGAKEGFNLALTIIPYLVAILTAVGMLRASGGLTSLVGWVSPIFEPLGMPGEVLPLALLRPLSGSGAFALTAELVKTHGPDSYIGQLASTLNGSMETTFYVLAVYFGSVGIIRSRHAVPAGLAADLAGCIGSIIAVKLLL